jgi:ABC-type transporter Mla subunit MlaD
MSDTQARTLVVVGSIAIVASVIGLVLGMVMVGNLSDYLEESVGVTESALVAVEETLGLIESVATEVEGAVGNAAQSIGAISEAAATASSDLDTVADFLDEDLSASIQALLDTMPAAIQTAGVIDNTLSALSFVGVNYNPDQPFDESLMAVEEALEGIPTQLNTQAEAIRGLVPVSQQFAEDAAATSESFETLSSELASSQQVVDSYRATLEQAQAVVERTRSSLSTTTWLLRLIIVLMTVTGVALGLGLYTLGRAALPPSPPPPDQPDGFDAPPLG